MIIVNKAVVSKKIIENYFSCDLMSCKGSCCVEGNGGAPIEKEEIKSVKKSFKYVKKYLSKKNLKEIKKQGVVVIGQDGELETPLVNGRECVYSIKNKNGIVKCAFEQAFRNKKTNFKKGLKSYFFVASCPSILIYLASPFITAAVPPTEESSVHVPVNIWITRLSLHLA